MILEQLSALEIATLYNMTVHDLDNLPNEIPNEIEWKESDDENNKGYYMLFRNFRQPRGESLFDTFIPNATERYDGFMSAADKVLLRENEPYLISEDSWDKLSETKQKELKKRYKNIYIYEGDEDDEEEVVVKAVYKEGALALSEDSSFKNGVLTIGSARFSGGVLTIDGESGGTPAKAASTYTDGTLKLASDSKCEEGILTLGSSARYADGTLTI